MLLRWLLLLLERRLLFSKGEPTRFHRCLRLDELARLPAQGVVQRGGDGLQTVGEDHIPLELESTQRNGCSAGRLKGTLKHNPNRIFEVIVL
jgi:hypothetical protein